MIESSLVSGVLQGFTVIFIVVGVGYLLGRSGVAGPEAQAVLSRVVFFVLTPALLLYSLATTDISQVWTSSLAIGAASASTIAVVYVIVARLWLRRAVPEAVVGALSASYVNSVNLAVPIAVFVLHDASFIAPLLMYQVMLLQPICLTALDLTARPHAERMSLLQSIITPFRNPIVMAGIAGLVISLVGWHPPKAILEPINMLGNASVPGALLAFGISLTALSVDTAGDGTDWRDLALVTVLKMIVQPVLVFVVAKYLLDQSGHRLFAEVVLAALPTAQNALIIATRYQRGMVLARNAGLVTTLLSIPAIALVAGLLG